MILCRKVRMLVIEDNDSYAYLIQRAFRGRKGETEWELSVAKDGMEAVRLLFEEEQEHYPLPDMILLDWKLPGLSGDEVLRRTKEHEKLRKIPVLIFSTSDQEEDIHAAYGAHANGYIVKPADPVKLEMIAENIEHFWINAATIARVER